jgi:hypothetical protein
MFLFEHDVGSYISDSLSNARDVITVVQFYVCYIDSIMTALLNTE